MIVTSEEYIKEMIVPRPREAHKGNFGRVLLVCGSFGMAGAAVMCAKAALRSGAGLVTVCAPWELFSILQTAVPEAMCVERDELISDEIDVNQFDAAAVGPGLRVGREEYRIVEHLLTSFRGPLVIDADGLNCICRYGAVPERETYMGDRATEETDAMEIPRRMTSLLPEITARRKAPVILTPHPGEADRLLEHLGQKKYKELGREKSAEVLAKESGAIIVLKGADTLVSAASTAAYGAGNESTEPDVFLNPTGNPGMATGGSGDVLTGVIAAMAACGDCSSSMDSGGNRRNCFSPLDAARIAVYIHGMAGDLAAAKIGEIGMTAMDVADALAAAFRQIAGK